MKIVVIGGGTGAYTTLRGLKRYSPDITAVVTMADDGGSSGRLRDELGHLPQGDVRRCLLALSSGRSSGRTLRELFEYRFDKGYGLNGHSFGNLLLAALTELTGSTEAAIREAAALLNIQGQVLPVTTDDVRLYAELQDGTVISGERNIDVRKVKPELRIRRVFLFPTATAYPPASEAIRAADILVIGPGDLYTSLLPNLAVPGIPEAIRECRGTRIYVCNIMTKGGETDGFAASDFLAEISRYIGDTSALDCWVANDAPLAEDVLAKYAREKSFPVVVDYERCQQAGTRLFTADLATRGELVRHDSRRLAELILNVHQVAGGDRREVAAGPARSQRRQTRETNA